MGAYLDAATRRVRDLFDGKRRFVIPLFQRPYAWTTEEAGALLSDIEAARDRAAEGGPRGWFIGSIVLARPGGAGPERIVDGHQRLTTLTILFAVLRDLDPAGVGAKISRHVIKQSGVFRRKQDALLSLRDMDAAFFFETIQTPGATSDLKSDAVGENDAQSNLISVALAFRAHLQAVSPARRAAIAEFALDDCHLIEVASADEDEAYRLFSVLNTRGKDLRPGDVLKSELLAASPAAERPRLADLWEETEASLGEAHFGGLFSHMRTIATLKKRERAVFAELRDAVNPLADPVAFIEDDLAAAGRLYRAIVSAQSPIPHRAAEADRLLRALRRVRNRDWEAVALCFLSRLPDLHDIDAETADRVVDLLRALDRRAYVMLMMSGDENMRVARYRPALAAIKADAPFDKILSTLALNPTERRVAREVLDGPLGSKERSRLPVLMRLDDFLGDGAADYEGMEITVEHVLPRNPEPDSLWMTTWSKAADRKKWLHRLGNLALLSRRRNNNAANFDFDRKKREYIGKGGATPFAITAQVLNEAEWTPDIVTRRHEKLLSAAYRLLEL